MASTQRNTIKYQLKVGNKVIHRDIAVHVDGGGERHQECWPTSHTWKVGKKEIHIDPVTSEKRGDRK